MPTFAQPVWLMVGLLACCGAVLFIILSTSRRKKELEQFAAPHLLPLLTANVSSSRRQLKNVLFVLGLACIFIALARPQHGHRWLEVRRRGIDILIGLDVSKSMLTPDIKPNRLTRAKLAVRDFAAKLAGDRIGLLPFAGTAFLMCPLTTDYDAFNASLDNLDTSSVPKGGTDIGGAIKQAGKVLANEANHKIFVLVTDGEDLSAAALKAAEAAKKEKMTIFTVGVGTPQGELVPLPDGQGGNFVKDAQGKFVTSKLDEKTLAAIAKITGGLHVPLGNAGQGFDAIYERKLAMIPKEEHEQRRRKVPIERFPWPLGAAVALLSIDFLLADRRRALRLPFIVTAGRRKLKKQTAAAMLLAAFCAAPARADEGSELFQAGKYGQAEKIYQDALKKDSANPRLHYNLGTCLHKQNKYAEAVKEFGLALKTDDIALQAKSYYNQGISQCRLGTAAEKNDDLDQAVQQLEQAQEAFEVARKLEPNNRQAGDNLKIVKKKLEELKKKQQEKPPQSGQQDKKQKDGKNSQQQNKDGGSQEQQSSRQGKDKQDQQDGTGQEKRKNEPENKQPGSQGRADEKKKDGQQAAAEPKKDRQPAVDQAKRQAEEQAVARKMMGKMTEEEAKNLLNSLKEEQGALNFIPQEAAGEDEVSKDW